MCAVEAFRYLPDHIEMSRKSFFAATSASPFAVGQFRVESSPRKKSSEELQRNRSRLRGNKSNALQQTQDFFSHRYRTNSAPRIPSSLTSSNGSSRRSSSSASNTSSDQNSPKSRKSGFVTVLNIGGEEKGQCSSTAPFPKPKRKSVSRSSSLGGLSRGQSKRQEAIIRVDEQNTVSVRVNCHRSRSSASDRQPRRALSTVEEDICIYRAPGEDKLGLGLRFVGGSKSSEFVKRLFITETEDFATSPASRVRCSWGAGLAPGDEIISISGRPVGHLTRLECVKALKASPVAVKMRIRHYFKDSSSSGTNSLPRPTFRRRSGSTGNLVTINPKAQNDPVKVKSIDFFEFDPPQRCSSEPSLNLVHPPPSQFRDNEQKPKVNKATVGSSKAIIERSKSRKKAQGQHRSTIVKKPPSTSIFAKKGENLHYDVPKILTIQDGLWMKSGFRPPEAEVYVNLLDDLEDDYSLSLNSEGETDSSINSTVNNMAKVLDPFERLEREFDRSKREGKKLRKPIFFPRSISRDQLELEAAFCFVSANSLERGETLSRGLVNFALIRYKVIDRN